MRSRTEIVNRLRRIKPTVRHYLSRIGTGPVYVFHHIPKTGGSSVNRMLPLWFYRIRDRRLRVNPQDWTAGHVRGPPIDLSRLRANDCLAGHWAVSGEYLHERYPEILADPRYRLFTFVREPLEMKLSLCYWEHRQGKEFTSRSMEEELLGRPNYLAERLPCTGVDYERVLSRYFFIGVTEYMQQSFDHLADLVGRSKVRLPHANRSRTASDKVELSSAFRREFRELNALDYLVYDHCLSRFTATGGLATESEISAANQARRADSG